MYTLAEAQEFYDTWKAAYLAVSSGQSYTLSTGGTSRTLTRANLDQIRIEMDRWKQELSKIQNNQRGIRTKYGTPSW